MPQPLAHLAATASLPAGDDIFPPLMAATGDHFPIHAILHASTLAAPLVP